MEVIVCQQRLKLAEQPRTKAMDAFNVPPDSEALMYLEKKRSWEGPYELIKYDNYKTVWVNVDGYIKPYSIASVKPYLTEDREDEETIDLTAAAAASEKEHENASVEMPAAADAAASPSSPIAKRTRSRTVQPPKPWLSAGNNQATSFNEVFNFIQNQAGRDEASPSPAMASVYYTIVSGPSTPEFNEADRAELQGLLNRGTYKIVDKEDVPPSATVLKGRMVRAIKHDAHGHMIRKISLVIQGHLDPEKEFVVNEAPTLLRSSVRILLGLGLS